jgi:signal transduction histidine kinase
MHDGIQHYLADIAIRLELARSLIPKDPATAARMAVDQRYVARQAAGELRYLVRLLRSPAVEEAGFVDALRNHLTLFAEGASLAASLEIVGDPAPLPPDVAHAAFRIMQEAIMNVQKHARAQEAKVVLRFAPDQFRCTIRDNGLGFDLSSAPEQPSATGGFGLLGMKQRAASVGGRLDVISSPGEGTEIAFTAPTGGAANLAQGTSPPGA